MRVDFKAMDFHWNQPQCREKLAMARESGFQGILIEPNEVVNGKPRWPGEKFGVQKHQFFTNTVQSLRRLSQTNLGAELISLIGKRHQGIGTSASGAQRTVTITFRPVTASTGASTAAPGLDARFSVKKTFGGRSISFAGKGSRTIIRMHNEANSDQIYTELAGIQTPTWIALAHELIHALHHLSGTTYKDGVQAEGGEVKREEMWTTGLGVYANTRISENAIRAEVGLPLRTFYTFPDDYRAIGSLLVTMTRQRPGFWYCSCLQETFGDR